MIESEIQELECEWLGNVKTRSFGGDWTDETHAHYLEDIYL